jgi:carbon storage regulator
MLVLTRRVGEEIVIDGKIRVTVVAMHGDRVRLGITAPENVRVDRQEIHERRSEFTGAPRTGQARLQPAGAGAICVPDVVAISRTNYACPSALGQLGDEPNER